MARAVHAQLGTTKLLFLVPRSDRSSPFLWLWNKLVQQINSVSTFMCCPFNEVLWSEIKWVAVHFRAEPVNKRELIAPAIDSFSCKLIYFPKMDLFSQKIMGLFSHKWTYFLENTAGARAVLFALKCTLPLSKGRRMVQLVLTPIQPSQLYQGELNKGKTHTNSTCSAIIVW